VRFEEHPFALIVKSNTAESRFDPLGKGHRYVHMQHEDVYTFVLVNDHETKMEANVSVDGKKIGLFGR
jgi:hypothetical protein